MCVSQYVVFLVMAGIVWSVSPTAWGATLSERVPEAFKQVYGRAPTITESNHWKLRVKNGEKKTFIELMGAMHYQKTHATTIKTKDKSAATTTSKANASKQAVNKQILIKDTLPLFIQIFGQDPTNTEKAWWRKRISCGEIKNEKELLSSMGFHKGKKVRKGSDAICGVSAVAAGASSGVSRRGVAGLSDHPMGDEVRIGIFKTNGSAIKVRVDGAFQIREGQNTIAAKLGKDDDVAVNWSNGKYHVRGSGLEIDSEQEIRIVPLKQAIVKIINYSDPSQTIPGKNYNRFRGVVEIRKCDGCNELWAINELRTEYYLRGLAETSGNGPEEYLKALAIAARTYVLYHKAITGGRFPKKGFDIANTPDDQIYRGYEFELITPRLASIMNKTKGIIVAESEGDKPVVTTYFSDSNGKTKSAKEAWNSSRFPHLQAVIDPHHAASACVGHCVGMSAQGAYGFANKDNWNFQKILHYFYKGIKLVKAY